MRRHLIRVLLLVVAIRLTLQQPHTWSTGFLDGVVACDLAFAAMSFIIRGPRVEDDPKRGTCKLPPPGWYCTLEDGHDGDTCPTVPERTR